jgi:hypothetical protein
MKVPPEALAKSSSPPDRPTSVSEPEDVHGQRDEADLSTASATERQDIINQESCCDGA